MPRTEPAGSGAGPSAQIDLHGSPWRLLALSLGSLVFVAICIWIVTWHPGAGPRGTEPGIITTIAAFIGIAFFGLAALVGSRRLVGLSRKGPTVSVGPLGIFDRRLSRDWIPWDAILGIAETRMVEQRWVTLFLDPNRESSLPLRSSAKMLARINRAFGFRGYHISAAELDGDFAALSDAVRAFQPRSLR